MVNPYCPEEHTLPYFLMSIFANHESFSSKVRTSFLMLSSFGYYVSKKLVEKNLDIYKQTVEKNLFV